MSNFSSSILCETFVFGALCVCICLFLIYLSLMLFQFRKQKFALEADRYPMDSLELIRSPKEMYYIPLKVAML